MVSLTPPYPIQTSRPSQTRMQTLPTELIAFIGIAYVCILFYIAWRGDQSGRHSGASGIFSSNRTLIYSLSLAVYCSSWTFFGAVGSAARSGWDFFAIYLGPILVFVFGYKTIQRIIIISKQYSITSISDFLSSRYGKSRTVAVLVTSIAVVGSLPYISLQLHAISMAFSTLTDSGARITSLPPTANSIWGDTAFYGALILALFSILFGTRHLSATEHHRGMMNAIAFESVVKLVAIVLVGLYASQLLFSHFNWQQLLHQPFELTSLGSPQSHFSWIDFGTRLLLSMSAILLLPRQFQVAVVESEDHSQLNSARWAFPAYLLLISLVAVPIALTGLLLLPSGTNADLFVLAIPQQNAQFSLATVAFVGGISAATGMVIVASISLSTMVSNDVVMPLLIRTGYIDVQKRPDLTQLILTSRRIVIVLVLLCSYGYFRLSGNNQQLANMGLLSFAAIIQFAPAMIAALYWRRANQHGVVLGLSAGFVVWAYCLLMPNFIASHTLDQAFNLLPWLHPHHLFNIKIDSPLTHGVMWSLLLNSTALFFGSLRHTPSVLDKIQASLFSHTHVEDQTDDTATQPHSTAKVRNARVLCESIIGAHNTNKLFDAQQANRKRPLIDTDKLDKQLIEAVERAIAGVIGTSSAQHIITTQLLGEDVTAEDLFVMMDETSQALQFNQDILQASFENMNQGISVVDKNLKLVAWNSRYKAMFDYPEELLKIGTPIEKLIRYNAEHGECGPGNIDDKVARRLHHLRHGSAYSSERQRCNGAHIKMHGNPIPGGGFVTSFTDITQMVEAAELLKRSNEQLEERVSERTQDLEHVNQKLLTEVKTTVKLSEELKAATQSKTRFLAAASHDLLQPINAARLFTNSLIETPQNQRGEHSRQVLTKIDSSLVNADTLLRALLDISKLDTGSLTPEISHFPLSDLMHDLQNELSPLANQKGLEITFRDCSALVTSDKTLLRSIIQNLISNAIRYTKTGRVSISCERTPKQLTIHIRDTGTGISEQNLNLIFNEFHRIPNPADSENRGLGLGLAITKRLSELLNHPIEVKSTPNKGSTFSIILPRHFGEIAEPKKKNKPWQPTQKLLGTTVLYLENSPESLDAMTTLLDNWGCETTACNDCAQAMALLNTPDLTSPGHSQPFPYDLIMADYRLDGEETGLDFLDQATALNPHITCILVTAEQDNTIKHQTREKGYIFLAKPVEPSSLRGILARHVNLQHATVDAL